MIITRIRTYPISLVVRPEFMIVSSAGKHAVSRYVLIEIETDGGLSGWGEATVVPLWSGETRGGALASIREYFTPILIGRDPNDLDALLGEMDAAVLDNWFTKAGIEMALLDLLGKQKGKPIHAMLGGTSDISRIPIKFSIGLREPEDAANIAAQKIREGFTALKMKVGPDPEKDLLRVQLVREAVGPKVHLNVDVNGGWSVEESLREIPRYERFNLKYVEQPTPRWDIDGLAKVRIGSPLPIMADEAVFSVWQAEEVIAKRAANLISIYPGKHGGILKAQRIAKLAGDAGVACHIGSNLEWDIATAAMCQLAAAAPNVQVSKFPVDILGPLYYTVRPEHKPVRFADGHVDMPVGPGLGLEIDRRQIEDMVAQGAKEEYA